VSFPLDLPDRTLASAPDLARLVLDDAVAGGGTVFSGQRPNIWLARLVHEGRLERKLAVGLCAALVRSGRPTAVAEAARLTESLDLHELADLLPAALDGLDVATLLMAEDPASERSVEDVLLGAWARVLRPDSAGSRDRLLTRLRNAGLRNLELAVLARTADPSTLSASLPPILVEDLATGDVAVLGQALVREPEVADALAKSAWLFSSSQRQSIWEAARARDPDLAATRFGPHGETWLNAPHPPARTTEPDDDEG
jgi:hypothetical protein